MHHYNLTSLDNMRAYCNAIAKEIHGSHSIVRTTVHAGGKATAFVENNVPEPRGYIESPSYGTSEMRALKQLAQRMESRMQFFFGETALLIFRKIFLQTGRAPTTADREAEKHTVQS